MLMISHDYPLSDSHCCGASGIADVLFHLLLEIEGYYSHGKTHSETASAHEKFIHLAFLHITFNASVPQEAGALWSSSALGPVYVCTRTARLGESWDGGESACINRTTNSRGLFPSLRLLCCMSLHAVFYFEKRLDYLLLFGGTVHGVVTRPTSVDPSETFHNLGSSTRNKIIFCILSSEITTCLDWP